MGTGADFNRLAAQDACAFLGHIFDTPPEPHERQIIACVRCDRKFNLDDPAQVALLEQMLQRNAPRR